MPAALDTRYLERRPPRTGRWYCVRDVPRDIRPILGKRLVQALHTDDVREARTRRHAVLAEFERRFADARRGGDGKLMHEAAEWAVTTRRLRAGDGAAFRLSGPDGGEETIEHKIAEHALMIDQRAIEIAGLPDRDSPAWVGTSPAMRARADRFSSIAHGATPLLLHADRWLIEGNQERAPAPGTVLTYQNSLKTVAALLEAEGASSVEAVNRAIAGRVVSSLFARGGHPRTIGRHVTAMSSYWRWLQRRGIAREDVRNPWHEQGLPSRASQKRIFTDDELLALLNGPATVECADVMRLLAMSGMRVSELYDLRCRDVAGGLFDIRKSKTPSGVRKVPIHSALELIITRRLAARLPDDFLIHEAGGEADRRSARFDRRFIDYRKRCGVDQVTDTGKSAVTLHTFRAWFASALRETQDTAVAATILGHEKTGITDSAYTKFPMERLRQAVESVRLPVA